MSSDLFLTIDAIRYSLSFWIHEDVVDVVDVVGVDGVFGGVFYSLFPD